VRALVTGINGFAGSHLACGLAEAGHEIFGLDATDRHPSILPPDITIGLADFSDPGAPLASYLSDFKPDTVFHLAGFSSPSLSRKEVLNCLKWNIIGTTAFLEAAAESVPAARIVVVTTAHFHDPASDGSITEESSMRALEPYSISKVCISNLCRFYNSQRNLKIIEARPTNHYGPGQQPGFVIPDFAKQVAEIAAGKAQPPIRVGNLDAARDFLYVADVVDAYIALAEKGKPGEAYCIGSGRPVQVSEILDILIDISGKSMDVEVDAGKLRPNEVPVVNVNSGKLRQDTGWQPATPLREGLKRTLDYWRACPKQFGSNLISLFFPPGT
jgi:GDP-4-dehydro-6-deoxy-D-mannose reductase